jgi:hypothetical protein
MPLWVTALTALSTFVVGLAVVFVALRQWQTAHYRLRLDLFDRRLAIYNIILSLIAAVRFTEGIGSRGIAEYLSGTNQARWLLDKATNDYLQDDLFLKVGELFSLSNKIKASTDIEERKKLETSAQEVTTWIERQRPLVDKMFDPFMQMPR